MLTKATLPVCHVTICVSLLLSAGCHKKAAVVRPPLILPTPPPTPVATIPAPVTGPETTPPPVQSPVAINPAPLPPPPAAPAPPPRARTPRPAPRVTPGPEDQPVVTPAPIPAPALGAILSAGERKKLDAEYQSDLRQANKVLNSVRGRALTPNQADTVSRVQAFISQAAQYHDRDLATAAELARRARVLTQDLAGAR